MKNLSIKVRITIWYSLFMLLMMVAILAFLFVGSSYQIKYNAQEKLKTTINKVIEEIEYEDKKVSIDDDLQLETIGTNILIYSNKQTLLFGKYPIDFPTIDKLNSNEFHYIKNSNKQWILYDKIQHLNGYGDIVIRGIITLDQTDQTITSMLNLALMILPLIIFLAVGGGFIITKQALKPLTIVANTAKEISNGDDLSKRLDFKQRKDEILNLSEAFNEMLEKLDVAFQREKQFTSDASHELKTPLSVILLESEYGLEYPKESEGSLKVINKQAPHMSHLVNQLLMLSRVDKQTLRLNIETINLSNLIESVVCQQEDFALEKNTTIHLSQSDEVIINGDLTLLTRLLINLINNAITYGKENGNIWIDLKLTETFVQCSIKDDGIGIAKEHLDRIFDRFFQVNPARNTENSGLGLALAKWIVEAHNGRLTVESEENISTTFTFILNI